MSVQTAEHESGSGTDEPLPSGAASFVDRRPWRADRTQESSEQPQQSDFGGLIWRYMPPSRGVLETTPAAAWADPAGQGWECVKRNSARTVWRAEIAGGAYYLKYYKHEGLAGRLKRALRGSACEREWDAGLYAQNAGISAARSLGFTQAVRHDGRMCSLLVTEAITPARSLSEFWRVLQSDDNAPRRWADKAYLIDLLAEMIAHAHQSGFEHCDMHAANILVRSTGPGSYATVFIDLQNARLGAPLSDRAVVRNLVQLNQWFRRHAATTERLRFLRRYIRWRQEYESVCEHARRLTAPFDRFVAALSYEADRHAERLWAKRDRRARRNSKYFATLRTSGGWRGSVYLKCKCPLDESPASAMELSRDWWSSQLSSPLSLFEQRAEPLRKDSHSAAVATARLDSDAGAIQAIVKRPLSRNWRRRLRSLFGASRSARGWRLGNALLHRDVPTARPLAVLERRVGPCVLDSVLLTEVVPAAVDLEMHLRRECERLSQTEWLRHKRALRDLLARSVRQLEQRGFTHRDCKAQNLLVVAEPRLKLIWIDMDGLRLSGPPNLARRLKTLARLNASLVEIPGVTRADRARFLKTYLTAFGSDPRAWRDAWRRVAKLSERKLAALGKRREWKRKNYGRE